MWQNSDALQLNELRDPTEERRKNETISKTGTYHLVSNSCYFFLLVIGLYWSLLIFIDLYWSSLIFIDLHWSLLIFIDLYWSLLIFIDLYCSLLIFIDLYWSLLIFIDLYWYLHLRHKSSVHIYTPTSVVGPNSIVISFEEFSKYVCFVGRLNPVAKKLFCFAWSII